MAQFLWYDCAFPAMYRPCDLDLYPMKVNVFFVWIEYISISILHKFQIDISFNSREIKCQNIGRTHTQTDRQTHRQTGWKQYIATLSGGEVMNYDLACSLIKQYRPQSVRACLWGGGGSKGV